MAVTASEVDAVRGALGTRTGGLVWDDRARKSVMFEWSSCLRYSLSDGHGILDDKEWEVSSVG